MLIKLVKWKSHAFRAMFTSFSNSSTFHYREYHNVSMRWKYELQFFNIDDNSQFCRDLILDNCRIINHKKFPPTSSRKYHGKLSLLNFICLQNINDSEKWHRARAKIAWQRQQQKKSHFPSSSSIQSPSLRNFLLLFTFWIVVRQPVEGEGWEQLGWHFRCFSSFFSLRSRQQQRQAEWKRFHVHFMRFFFQSFPLLPFGIHWNY